MLKSLLKHKNSSKTILIENDEVISYEDLYKKSFFVGSVISGFYSKNNMSDIIGIFLPNSSNFILSFLAVLFQKKVIAPLNPTLSQTECLSLIEYCDINLILTTKNYKPFFKEICKKQKSKDKLKIIYIDDIDFSKSIPKKHKFNSLTVSADCSSVYTAKKHKQNRAKEQNKNSAFILLPTSGTTGSPKIVALSQKNIYASVKGFDEKLNYKKNDYCNKRLILMTPYFATYGIMVILWSLIRQVELFVYQEDFSFDKICGLIDKYKITNYEGGSVFIYWLEKMDKEKLNYDISSLEYIGFGGSKVSKNTLKKAMENHNHLEMFQGYGMTEAGPLVSKVNLKSKSKQLYLTQKLDSVGTAIKGVKIYISKNNKLIRKPFAEGEIVVKGTNVMIGYYKNPFETKKVKVRNMIHSGDIGFFDKQGYIYIIGRQKNIIVVRGINIYPEQIESILENCEYIKEAKVYAENKLEKDEFICADIVLSKAETSLELIHKYIKKSISSLKRPKKINIVSEIERGNTGKKKRG